MNKQICIIIFLLTCRICSAQTPSWIWARSGGGISNDYSNATCTDANGNIYITGTFQSSTITFGSYTLSNTATGSLDVFIAKYDASGNVLWAESGGGTEDDYSYGICADVNGNVYITGYHFSNTITFGAFTLINLDSTDAFVVKYDGYGNVLWAKNSTAIGINSYVRPFGICVDADSNVYTTGEFDAQTIIFGTDTLTRVGGGNTYIVKYDASGNVIWAKKIWGNQVFGGYCIGADASGNIYVSGNFQYHAIFETGDTLFGGYCSGFIAKYDTYGNKLWAKILGGVCSGGTCVTADAFGNVYLGGFFQYSLISGDTLGNSGNISIFLSKYDTSGNALWARTPGGTGDDFAVGICHDANGNVFMTGYFVSSFLNFGGNPVLNASAGYDDIFVASYDSIGNALWAKGIGGIDYDYGMGICSSTTGDVYVTGYFGSYSLNFGSTTITNNGSYDIFLAKLGLPTGIEETNSTTEEIFPNPFFDRLNITVSDNILSEIVVYDIASRKILQQKFINSVALNTEQLARGLYLYEVRNKDGLCKKGKVVKD